MSGDRKGVLNLQFSIVFQSFINLFYEVCSDLIIRII